MCMLMFYEFNYMLSTSTYESLNTIYINTSVTVQVRRAQKHNYNNLF